MRSNPMDNGIFPLNYEPAAEISLFKIVVEKTKFVLVTLNYRS